LQPSIDTIPLATWSAAAEVWPVQMLIASPVRNGRTTATLGFIIIFTGFMIPVCSGGLIETRWKNGATKIFTGSQQTLRKGSSTLTVVSFYSSRLKHISESALNAAS
jgi:hypothetical protein